MSNQIGRFVYIVSSFARIKAQTLVDSLSELMVDASLGTIQCLEEIVSDSLLLPHFLSILDHGKHQKSFCCPCYQ